MQTPRVYHALAVALVAALALSNGPAPVAACTRVLYVAKDGTVITGRSMDWGEDLKSNMWVLPRGMKRDGMGGTNSIAWESKYGSLIVSGYDIGTSEGMNEKGLVVNMLALVESDYGTAPAGAKVRHRYPGPSCHGPGSGVRHPTSTTKTAATASGPPPFT